MGTKVRGRRCVEAMMWELELKAISEVGVGRYRVIFVDDGGNEYAIVCELYETDIGTVMSRSSETTPDIFTMGRADSMATAKALVAFRERKRRGET